MKGKKKLQVVLHLSAVEFVTLIKTDQVTLQQKSRSYDFQRVENI